MKRRQRLRSWIPRLSGRLAVACFATLCLLLLATSTAHAGDCGDPADCSAVADNANTATGIAGGIAGVAIGLAVITAIRRNGRTESEGMAAEGEIADRETDTVDRQTDTSNRETDTGARAGEVESIEPIQPPGGSPIPPEDEDVPRRSRRTERERHDPRAGGSEGGDEEYPYKGSAQYGVTPSGTPLAPQDTPSPQPDIPGLQSDPPGSESSGLQTDPPGGTSGRQMSPGGGGSQQTPPSGGGGQQTPPGGGTQQPPDVVPVTPSHTLQTPAWLGGFYTPEQWVVIAAARRARTTGLTVPQAQSLVFQAQSVGLPVRTPDVPADQFFPETVSIDIGPVEDIPVTWSVG